MSREDLIAPVVVLVTSLIAYVITRRSAACPKVSLRLAAGRFFECVGLAVLFFVVNVGLIFFLALLVRVLGMGFVSFYVAHDTFLLILSVAQALFFSLLWRAN